jgi:hypothetical protein
MSRWSIVAVCVAFLVAGCGTTNREQAEKRYDTLFSCLQRAGLHGRKDNGRTWPRNMVFLSSRAVVGAVVYLTDREARRAENENRRYNTRIRQLALPGAISLGVRGERAFVRYAVRDAKDRAAIIACARD